MEHMAPRSARSQERDRERVGRATSSIRDIRSWNGGCDRRLDRGMRALGKALRLDRRALGQPELERIAHGQCGTPGTLRNLWMFFNPATKLRAKLPDKGRVVVPRDRKAIDSSLTLNSSCLLSHLIAHFTLPDRAGVLLLESHVGGPRFIAQPIDECEMHHARLRIDLVSTPAPGRR